MRVTTLAAYPQRLFLPVGTSRSLVAHLLGVQGVAGSNPAVPTNSDSRSFATLRISAGGSDAAKSPQVQIRPSRPFFLNEPLLSFGDGILPTQRRPRWAGHPLCFICDLCSRADEKDGPRGT